MPDSARHLLLILGDQLSRTSPILADADPERDVVIMAEVDAEVKRYPNHKQRIALFFAAMRHHAAWLRDQGYTVAYQHADDEEAAAGSLPDFLQQQVDRWQPEGIALVEPGRYDLGEALQAVADEVEVPMTRHEDPSFLCSTDRFTEWADGRKTMILEHFYRMMRKETGYLMEGPKGKDPVGGEWNFDKENRKSFGKSGPPEVPGGTDRTPDAITQSVLDLVADRYADLPGSLDGFAWPVTPEQAEADLADFIEHRLPDFGTYQDAMWTDRPFLFHARLGAAINLKLLDPRDAIEAAIQAYHDNHAPINAVEGFVRQILGWREFIRGIYWHHMPDYIDRNALDAQADLPEFFWTGETDMVCISQTVQQLLDHAYAHHIQRLMVTGLFALLYGVEPKQIHDWYMAMYVDSVEWVTLPNTIGMSQFADGGIVGTKPYTASGKYIKRMSNYCAECRYNPDNASGEDACPFTTLYWSFLMRHEERLQDNRRMNFQMRNLTRKADDELTAIAEREEELRARWGG